MHVPSMRGTKITREWFISVWGRATNDYRCGHICTFNEIQRNYCKGTCSSSTRYMNQSSTTAELSAGSHSNSHDADVQPVPLWPWRLFVARRWFESKQFMRNIKRRKRFTYVSCDHCTTRSVENPYRAVMALFQRKSSSVKNPFDAYVIVQNDYHFA